jgi:anti-sigma regulatory factor (Ser/Thr protein kinase)
VRGDAEAREWVARARAGGHGLGLRADFAELDRLGPWLRSPLGLAGLPDRAAEWLESALYEVCGNVVEHGYGCDGQRVFELWWLKREDGGASVRGWFVLVENGREFDLPAAVPVDLSRLESRLKGRGLGITMIRRLMPRVRYRAATAEGNVTVLEFDSDQALDVMKGVRDARCA